MVDSHLRLDGNVIGVDLAEEIIELLTIENEEKIEKSYRNHYGWWELPDDFILADLDGDTLVMPRGFALVLKQLLREHGIKVRWRDNRRFERGVPFEMKPGFDPRDHQPLAVRRMLHHQQGIYVAPTGSGKTVETVMEVQQICPAHAMIVVNRVELLDQWIKAFVDNTNLETEEMGRIGNGSWTEGQVTIAIAQSIWSDIDELIADNWFDKWSYVRLDECHNVTALTINEIMDRFTARFRGGTSATPAKTGNFMLATTVLGEIVHEDDLEELKRKKVLVEPEVEVVSTDFDVPFWGDHAVERDKYGHVEHCEVPKCPKSGKVPHRHRNNYASVLSQLIRDNVRNHRVAAKVEEHLGRVQLIVSDQTTQLDEIRDVLGSSLYGIPQDEIFMLTGKTKKAKRQEIVEHLKTAKSAVVLSTVAGEGLDIPVIEVVHMPFPTKNGDKVRQIVGRAMRVSAGKTSCLILDYADKKMGVFRSQLSNRVHKCYMKMRLKITGYEAREPTERNRSGLGRL